MHIYSTVYVIMVSSIHKVGNKIPSVGVGLHPLLHLSARQAVLFLASFFQE